MNCQSEIAKVGNEGALAVKTTNGKAGNGA